MNSWTPLWRLVGDPALVDIFIALNSTLSFAVSYIIEMQPDAASLSIFTYFFTFSPLTCI